MGATLWRAAGARVCARINSLREDGPLDLAHVVPANPDFVAYPKAAMVDEIRDLDQAITVAEAQAGLAPGSIGILPVCETALGVVNVREIASASTRIRYALLGAEDLAADLMAEHRGSGVSCCPLCPRSGNDVAPPLGGRGAVYALIRFQPRLPETFVMGLYTTPYA